MRRSEKLGSWRVPLVFGGELRRLVVFACVLGTACAGNPSNGPKLASDAKPIAPWVFAGTDGTAVSSADTRGRVTILVFITTYDPASQIAASRLERCIHSLPRRVNAIAVAMEAPDHAILVSTFHDSLRLSYPVLMPDPATLVGQGPFGTIDTVPTWVLLDPQGQEVWRGVGARALSDLADNVSRLENVTDRQSHGCS